MENLKQIKTPAQLIMQLIQKRYPIRPFGVKQADEVSDRPEVEITIDYRNSNIKLWLQDKTVSESSQEIATFNRPLKYEEIQEIIKAIRAQKQQISSASYEYYPDSKTVDGKLTLSFGLGIEQLEQGSKVLSCGDIELSIIFKCDLREHQEIMSAISRDYGVTDSIGLDILKNASEKTINLSVGDYLSVLNPGLREKLEQNPDAVIEDPQCGVFNLNRFRSINFVNCSEYSKGTSHAQINKDYLTFARTMTNNKTGEIVSAYRSIPLGGEISTYIGLDTRQIIKRTIAELRKDTLSAGFCLNIKNQAQAIETLSRILYRESESKDQGQMLTKKM